MHPIFWETGGHVVYWYGILFSLGFLAAIIHWSVMAHQEGWPFGFGVELGLWFMILTVIGARAAFVLSELPAFLEDPIHIIRIDQGGLIFYGGAIGALLTILWMAKRYRIPVFKMADFTILAIPLGHAIGRIGCLLNGCCYGAPTTLAWGIPMHDALRHPTALTESLFNVGLYVLLLKVYRSRHRHGRVFALYLMLYPTFRFFIEFLRGDPRMTGVYFHIAQELSLFFIFLGATLWWGLPATRRHDHDRLLRRA